MDRVYEKDGVYVVITEEGEFSIEKKYFEGDKPYEVLGRTAYFSLKSKEYADLIWDIKLDEIIPKLCEDPKVNAKVYFLVLEYLGYVKIRERSVEIKRRNLKTILHLYKGMVKYLEEEIEISKKLAESIEIEEASRKINEGITKMDEVNTLIMKLQLVKRYYEAKMTRYDVLVNQLKPLIVALESLSPDVVEKDFFDLPEEIRKEIHGMLMSLIGWIERTFSGEFIKSKEELKSLIEKLDDMMEKAEERARELIEKIEKEEERERKYVREAKESAERDCGRIR